MTLKRLLSRFYNKTLEKIPGRTPEEKKIVMDILILTSILLLYTSPLPSYTLTNINIPKAILAIILLIVIPLLAIKHMTRTLNQHTKKLAEKRKQNQQPTPQQNNTQ